MNGERKELTTNRLFVYGIFLDEDRRQRYGMKHPEYSTVPGWLTIGDSIVEAVPFKVATLTGVTVDVDPRMWERLDRLERGYDRIVVRTIDNEEVYMYVNKEWEKFV